MFRPLPESYYRFRTKEELISWLETHDVIITEEERGYDADYFVQCIMNYRSDGNESENDGEASPRRSKRFYQPYLGSRERYGTLGDEREPGTKIEKKQNSNLISGVIQLLCIMLIGLVLTSVAKPSLETFWQHENPRSEIKFWNDFGMNKEAFAYEHGREICSEGFFLHQSECLSDKRLVELIAQDMFLQAQLHLTDRAGNDSFGYGGTTEMNELDLKYFIHRSLTEEERNTLNDASEYWEYDIFDKAFAHLKSEVLLESTSIKYDSNAKTFSSKIRRVSSIYEALKIWSMGNMHFLIYGVFAPLTVCGLCYLFVKSWRNQQLKN